ncbi:hypothetical protein HanRHA438_Chr10g0455471 [Helianthus annuus]|nr:hypothetical protein HanRHA438_Chr10g0455471 [Helianthus annuus]
MLAQSGDHFLVMFLHPHFLDSKVIAGPPQLWWRLGMPVAQNRGGRRWWGGGLVGVRQRGKAVVVCGF